MDMLSRARAVTVMSHPFFGSLLLRMKMVPDPTVETTMCNGAQIRYNPKFVDSLDLPKAMGLLCATTMHMVMMHHLRRGGRDPSKWNMACDLAIEAILIDAGLQLPKKNPLPSGLSNLSAERIYDELPDQPPGPNGSAPQDPGGNGGIEDSEGTANGDQEKATEEETTMRSMVAEAAQIAKQMGMLPGKLQEAISEAIRPVVHWPSVLRKFLTERMPDDFTWARGNRRFVHQGLYLPSVNVTPTGILAVYVDTSGSVSSAELSQFLAEIRAIYTDLRPKALHIIGCDARVQSHQVFEGDDVPAVEIKGRGGTDFRPPFNRMRELDIRPQCAVYLTDGEGPYPDEHDVDYPVLWCVTTARKPPFGEHVELRVS